MAEQKDGFVSRRTGSVCGFVRTSYHVGCWMSMRAAEVIFVLSAFTVVSMGLCFALGL